MGYIKYAENKENKKTEESIKYEDIYESPIGKIFISCNETGLTEVSFVKEEVKSKFVCKFIFQLY